MDIARYYSEENSECSAPLGLPGVVSLVVIFCLAGLIWAYRNFKKVTEINMMKDSDIDLSESDSINYDNITPAQKKLLAELGEKISEVNID